MLLIIKLGVSGGLGNEEVVGLRSIGNAFEK